MQYDCQKCVNRCTAECTLHGFLPFLEISELNFVNSIENCFGYNEREEKDVDNA